MPSITSTRASAVPRSRIIRGRARHQRRRSAARQAAGPRRRGSSRRGSGAGRRRRAARRGRALSRPAAEEAEEIALRRQHEGGVLAVQRVAIGLQRAVEGEELLVLAERIGIGLDRLRVAIATHSLGIALRLGEDDGALALGIGAHVLRRLGALAAVLPGLLLALGLHASV